MNDKNNKNDELDVFDFPFQIELPTQLIKGDVLHPVEAFDPPDLIANSVFDRYTVIQKV